MENCFVVYFNNKLVHASINEEDAMIFASSLARSKELNSIAEIRKNIVIFKRVEFINEFVNEDLVEFKNVSDQYLIKDNPGFIYKIRNKSTGLFSSGGNSPVNFSVVGSFWRTFSRLRIYLRSFLGKSNPYLDSEVVIYHLNEVDTISLEEFYKNILKKK